MSNAFALLAAGLPSLGWNVETVDLADRTPPRRRESFTFARAASATSCVLKALRRIPGSGAFYLTISQSKFGFLKDAVMLLWAMAWGVPTVAHLHGGNIPALWARLGHLLRALFRFVYGRVDLVIVLADCFRDQFRALGESAPPVQVVANATELPLGTPRAWRPGVFRILYLSNMQVEKGYLEALAMLEVLSTMQTARPVALHLCGAFAIGGPFSDVTSMERDFHDRCGRLPRGVEVTWHGLVNADEKLRLLDQCDVLILPSLIPEGQPLAIIEAMTRGLAIAAYDWPGTRSMLTGSLSAGVVPAGDFGAMAHALASWMTKPGLLRQASEAAVALAMRYRPERHVMAVSECLSFANDEAPASSS
jgi:glycosyltransferase involved in cell wall biosynthesis